MLPTDASRSGYAASLPPARFLPVAVPGRTATWKLSTLAPSVREREGTGMGDNFSAVFLLLTICGPLRAFLLEFTTRMFPMLLQGFCD